MYAENSGFLNTIGLGSFDIGYIFLIMIILIIVLLVCKRFQAEEALGSAYGR